MTDTHLESILHKHYLWLNGKDEGERADLYGADLRRANLYGADLRGADLRRANLREANLRKANLREADLYGADLREADLYGADLREADLRKANLREADLSEIVASSLMTCPEEGSFIGWKKCKNYIIKLRIPEDAKRSSATTRKCRCSKAEVLAIQNIDGNESGITKYIHDAYNHATVYEIGKTVYPDSFDDDRWNECSNGIHFFITRTEAVEY